MAEHSLPELGSNGRIVEGIITTLNEDGSPNISPMGPIVDNRFQQFVLRPYQTSTTYLNLKRTGHGVFHVTDDLFLFAQAALGTPEPLPAMENAAGVDGMVLSDACHWYALQVTQLDDSHQRTEIVASCVDRGRLRDFLGYNRAQFAVIEAAILATRVHLLPGEKIFADLERLETLVTKTGSHIECKSFDFLRHYCETNLGKDQQT